MSCLDCSKVQQKGHAAYYRIQNANVGILGCDTHVGLVFMALMKMQREGLSRHAKYSRDITRLKSPPKELEIEKAPFNWPIAQ